MVKKPTRRPGVEEPDEEQLNDAPEENPGPEIEEPPGQQQPEEHVAMHPTFVGPGQVTTEDERRCAYALSEKGEVLVKDTVANTYTVLRAHDGGVALAAGQAIAAIKTRGRTVDPKI